MRRNARFGTRLAVSVVLGLLFSSSGRTTAAQGVSEKQRELKVVVLEGSPHQCGLVHGRTLRNEIVQLVQIWKTNLTETFNSDADQFITAFLKQTDYVAAIRRWTPDLLEEIRGIADGSELPFNTILAFQLLDEIWVNGKAVRREFAAEHCSGLGVAKKGTNAAYVAQNMDLESFRDGFQTVLHIKAEGRRPEQFVFTFAGFIAANGMNDHSIGICANTLSQLRHCRDGLPVACVIRGTLERTTPNRAIKFLKQIKHASGQNYILGCGDRVFDFECSAGRVVRFTPTSDTGVVYHTNHPLANDDYDAEYAENLRKIDPAKTVRGNSEIRFQTLENRLKDLHHGIDVSLIESTLCSHDSREHPISRPVKEKTATFTFGSTIMKLSNKPEFLVAPGPPDMRSYTTFNFSKLP
jgi:predicted choloylglycine hydrolase